MRLAHAQFTVRRLMIAVAILGTTLWSAQRISALLNWRTASLERAFQFGGKEWQYGAIAERMANTAEQERDKARRNRAKTSQPAANVALDPFERQAEEIARVYDEFSSEMRDYETYYRALRQKHERSARYPWLPLEPDPPRPKSRN